MNLLPQLNWLDWLYLLLFIIVSTYGLRFATYLVRRYVFNIDPGERREIIEAEVESLKREHKEQVGKILDLEKQNKIFVYNYEGTIIKLGELQKKYDILLEENKQLKEQVDSLYRLSETKKTKSDKVLYVIIGSENVGLSLDLASIRGVEMETGLDVEAVKDITPGILQRKLAAARREKNHIYLHMAIKTDKDGYLIGKEIVDANWLTSVLEGVLVLVVAGADSNYVGEFLSVVPYVITMKGDISSRDTALFSRAFWTEIGRGIGPTLALKRALEKSPESMRNSVVKHWET